MKLYVVELRGSGGMIHYAYQMCTALANHGDDVTLVTSQNYELTDYPHNFKVSKELNLWTPTDPRSSYIPKNRFEKWWRKFYSSGRRGLRALRLLSEWVRLTRLLLAAKPDIVQFGVTFFPLEAFFLGQLHRRGIRLAQICHEFEFREQSKNLYVAWVTREIAKSYSYFSAIFFHAEENRRRFLAQFQEPLAKTHLIPMGTVNIFVQPNGAQSTSEEVDRRYQLEPDCPLLLFFGILTVSKGLPDLLQAFAILHQQYKTEQQDADEKDTGEQRSKVKLLIAGYPSKFIDIAELQQLTVELGIGDAVIWDTRYIPNEEVQGLMERATAVVYPYRNGSQSASIQVAYAFGRPVVATRVGGLPEIVEDGKSGLLVEPEAPDQLARALQQLLADRAMAERMGKHAKFLSETKYAWQPIADQILEVYRGLLGESGSSQVVNKMHIASAVDSQQG